MKEGEGMGRGREKRACVCERGRGREGEKGYCTYVHTHMYTLAPALQGG